MVYLAILSRKEVALACAYTLNGALSLSVFSICYELAVEQTFPVGEAASGGLINSIANFIGFIVVLSLTPVL